LDLERVSSTPNASHPRKGTHCAAITSSTIWFDPLFPSKLSQKKKRLVGHLCHCRRPRIDLVRLLHAQDETGGRGFRTTWDETFQKWERDGYNYEGSILPGGVKGYRRLKNSYSIDGLPSIALLEEDAVHMKMGSSPEHASPEETQAKETLARVQKSSQLLTKSSESLRRSLRRTRTIVHFFLHPMPPRRTPRP
jgi:hypothetical protein